VKRLLPRLALAALSLVLALGLSEVGARVLRARADAKLFDEATFVERKLPPRGNVSLGHLIRVSANPDLVYELRADLDQVAYAGAKVSTNHDGFRDRNYGRKGEGTVRILGLGDSVMFGQGVGETAPYLVLLENLLAEAHAERRWEVLNAAVPGYNTAQEVALLEDRGLAFEPDLVILGFVSNDVNLPSFLAERADVFSLRRSFLLDLFRDRADSAQPIGLVPAPTQPERVFRVEDDVERVPPKWRHLVGWEAVERSLDRLAELASQHGFEVLVFVHRESEHSERALEAANARGFATCNLGPRVARYLEDRGLARYPGSELTVSDEDPHPSPIHHELAADALLRALERTGLLARLVPD
jgi:lysophospholipase L1-like esterase